MPTDIARLLQEEGCSVVFVEKPLSSTRHALELSGLPPSQVALCSAIRTRQGQRLAMFPATHCLLPEKLEKAFKTEIQGVVLTPDMPAQWKASETYLVPPLPHVFSMPMLVDSNLQQQDVWYFPSGTEEGWLQVQRKDLEKVWGESFAYADLGRPLAECQPSQHQGEGLNSFGLPHYLTEYLQDQITIQNSLPIVPPIAGRILRLRADPNATIQQLTEVVLQSPDLAAQMLRWANSVYYGKAGQIHRIPDAIYQLGFEVAMNLALSLAIGQKLKLPENGLISLKTYWRFSLYAAVLAEDINHCVRREVRLPVGMGYMIGLLHNVGILVYNHLFPQHFQLLNELLEYNLHIPQRQMERALLGVDHTQLGGWLLNAWSLPEEVINTNFYHHDPFDSYEEESKNYLTLIHTTIALLRSGNYGMVRFMPSKRHKFII